MLYLIGVHHQLQSNSDHDFASLRRYFIQYLSQIVSGLKVQLIAEENSSEALGGFSSTLAELAQQLNVEHRYCDPNSLERKEAGIMRRDEYNSPEDKRAADIKREKIWLSRIDPNKAQNVLFICGANHVTSFILLLRQNNWDVKLLSEHWDYEELLRRDLELEDKRKV